MQHFSSLFIYYMKRLGNNSIFFSIFVFVLQSTSLNLTIYSKSKKLTEELAEKLKN